MDDLARLFSVGGDEIDLVADSVPGRNERKECTAFYCSKVWPHIWRRVLLAFPTSRSKKHAYIMTHLIAQTGFLFEAAAE